MPQSVALHDLSHRPKSLRLFHNAGMGIGHYLREIGRGKQGARNLSREHAADLMEHLLDDKVSDLQRGAFCIAMRVKGETADEMTGFLDAVTPRLNRFENGNGPPVVVLPSYNGARRLPLLTPLLGMLLVQQGLRVLVHGGNTEDTRVSTHDVMQALGMPVLSQPSAWSAHKMVYVPADVLCPSLWRLLNVRRDLGLRNTGHSLVKLINPVTGPAVLVANYTHPEYESCMVQTLLQTKSQAMVLRGTEGEPVADPRRPRKFTLLMDGTVLETHDPPSRVVTDQTVYPMGLDVPSTVEYIRALSDPHNAKAVPLPIQHQVSMLCKLASRIR